MLHHATSQFTFKSTAPFSCSSHCCYLWLMVVLHGHGDDINPNDEGDEEVQVVAGTQSVDVESGRRVIGIVRAALGFYKQQDTAQDKSSETSSILYNRAGSVTLNNKRLPM